MNIYQLTRNARRAAKGKRKHVKKMFSYAQKLSTFHTPVRSSIPKKKQKQSYGLIDLQYGGPIKPDGTTQHP